MASEEPGVNNDRIIAALQTKRTVIATGLRALELEVTQRRAELEHIEAVLRIFNPDFVDEKSAAAQEVDQPDTAVLGGASDGSAPTAQSSPLDASATPAVRGARTYGSAASQRQSRGRKKQQPRFFRRGELPDLCLEVLRSANGSLLQSDGIAAAINRKKGFMAGADRHKAATARQTRPVLRTLARRGIVRRVGAGKTAKWRLANSESRAAV